MSYLHVFGRICVLCMPHYGLTPEWHMASRLFISFFRAKHWIERMMSIVMIARLFEWKQKIELSYWCKSLLRAAILVQHCALIPRCNGECIFKRKRSLSLCNVRAPVHTWIVFLCTPLVYSRHAMLSKCNISQVKEDAFPRKVNLARVWEYGEFIRAGPWFGAIF